jgi:hypothetical protein
MSSDFPIPNPLFSRSDSIVRREKGRKGKKDVFKIRLRLYREFIEERWIPRTDR